LRRIRVRSDDYLLNFERGAVLCQCELEVGNDRVPMSDPVAASHDFRLMGSRRTGQSCFLEGTCVHGSSHTRVGIQAIQCKPLRTIRKSYSRQSACVIRFPKVSERYSSDCREQAWLPRNCRHKFLSAL